MKSSFNSFRMDKIAFRGFIASFILTVITTIYILINYAHLPPFVPIFNQLPWGNQRLTQTPGIFISMVIFAIIFIFNLGFTFIVYSKNPLIARMLAATTLLVAIMNFLFIARTILVVI
jgi:hypothetical protein